MLAYMLPYMLATLSGVEALSHMQADHDGVGSEAHIPLTSSASFKVHAFTLVRTVWVSMFACVCILLYDNYDNEQ